MYIIHICIAYYITYYILFIYRFLNAHAHCMGQSHGMGQPHAMSWPVHCAIHLCPTVIILGRATFAAGLHGEVKMLAWSCRSFGEFHFLALLNLLAYGYAGICIYIYIYIYIYKFSP